MRENILVLGATSGIATALCAILARRGCGLVLGGRNAEELHKLAADLQIRYSAQVATLPLDALDFDSHAAFFARCIECQGPLDGVVLCVGYLPDQEQTELDTAELRLTIDTNLTSAMSLLNLAAACLLRQARRGYIAAISSVAGDRGRQSNYTYGASKAGLSAYLQGLRNRLRPAGIHVLTIKPGMVATPMTDGVVDPQSPLLASTARVARDIDLAIRRRRSTLYTPWFWRPVMAVIRGLPEAVFCRLKL